MTGPGVSETKVSVYLSILQAAAALLGNPALGVSGAARIIGLVGLASSLIRGVAQGSDELHRINSLIQQLKSEKRAPTEAEWAAFQVDIEAIDASAARRKSELGG